jgi:hypothetical protein
MVPPGSPIRSVKDLAGTTVAVNALNGLRNSSPALCWKRTAFFRRPPFTGTGPVEQMLTGCGYRAVDTITCQVETVYASPGQWWAACRSQGPWAISWRHIPPAQLKVALTEAFAALEDLRGPDGTLTFAITTATRPKAAAD